MAYSRILKFVFTELTRPRLVGAVPHVLLIRLELRLAHRIGGAAPLVVLVGEVALRTHDEPLHLICPQGVAVFLPLMGTRCN